MISRDELLSRIKPIEKIKSVKAIVLFGSQATGKTRADSDIDLAVIMHSPSLKEEAKVIGIGNEKYDISLFHKLPLSAQFQIINYGQVIFCSDKILMKEIKSLVNKFNMHVNSLMEFAKEKIENCQN